MNSPSKNPFNFPEVRVVEASAGSGKTYALAKRYIQLIFSLPLSADKTAIRNILAITFTNKASFEMKARILEFLKRISFNDLSNAEYEDICSQFEKDPKVLSQKARLVMDNLIHNYNFFQVETIDKFMNSLLCGCAFKIGLTSNFRIRTNSKEYLQYSLDQLIDQARFDERVFNFFKGFLHNYLYLENRSGWFPRDDILSIISELFNRNNSYGYLFQESRFNAEDIIKTKKAILEEIKLLQSILPDKTKAVFMKSLNSFLEKNQKGFDVDSLSNFFLKDDFPILKGGEVSDEVENLWHSIRLKIKRSCIEEAYALFDPYIRIFTEVLKGFDLLSSKDDVLFLSQLNKKASLLFDEEYVTVEELYYRLATRFNHYLIDEFQDTSRLQWHNLFKMAEEALSTGGSLFYVGDKKQAIYTFRGGDSVLFDQVKNEFKNFNVQTDLLKKNYRSQKAIVEFNNKVFSLSNINSFIAKKEQYESDKKKKNQVVFSQRDRKSIEEVFRTSEQAFKDENDKGYVHMEYVDIDKKEERDEAIKDKLVSRIKELKERFNFSDIAILVRSNSEVEQLTSWLLEKDILVDSERTSNINQNELINDLISFLRFLNSPIDNISFASFILSDFFCKRASIPKEKMHEFIFGLRDRLHKEKDLYLYIEFRKHFKDIWDSLIDEFFRNVGLYPLYELVISIYNKFTLMSLFPDSQGFLMHLLELIKKQEEEYFDVGSFIEYFEEIKGEDLYIRMADIDAVRIMTVHKSKGLEFPVVILPFLGMNLQVGSTSEDNKQSYVLRQKKDHLELLRLKAGYLEYSDELYDIYRDEYKSEFISEMNNVYVALTRAQNEMYSYIPKKIGSHFNIIRFLIPEDIFQVGEKAVYKKKEAKKSQIIKIAPSLHRDWIDYLKEEFTLSSEVINRAQIKEGEIYHRILSFIKDLSSSNIEDVLPEAIDNIKDVFYLGDGVDIYAEKIKTLVFDSELKRFFFLDGAQVFTEKEIVNHFGDTKRIDRLVIKDDEAWIIDYKSKKETGNNYKRQVLSYMELLKDIYPKKHVRGFLVYIEGVCTEEII